MTETKYVHIGQLNEEKLGDIVNEIVEKIKYEIDIIKECIDKEAEKLFNKDKVACRNYEIKIIGVASITLNTISELESRIRDELERKLGIKHIYGGTYSDWLSVYKDGKPYMELKISVLRIQRYRIYDIAPHSIYIHLV